MSVTASRAGAGLPFLFRSPCSVALIIISGFLISCAVFCFKQKTAYEIHSYWSSDVCSSDLSETLVHIGKVGARLEYESFRVANTNGARIISLDVILRL